MKFCPEQIPADLDLVMTVRFMYLSVFESD